ncbi:MAG TPA: metal ABC transporter ATP-binding protein [Verrucomicrobiae bacterium]|nr:metal ABC transporter ATP-binding protein [Verrucomicrobiae bacterium]
MHAPHCEESSVPLRGQRLLTVNGLGLTLSQRRILQDINLDLKTGEFLGLIGPNGGGKTSLLRVILGILAPTCGEVIWRDPVTAGKPGIGYVPQRSGVDRNYPLRTLEIVTQGSEGALPRWGARGRELRRQAEASLRRVGLEAEANTPFAVLSGGQQRRALVARALMDNPKVLLIDEPTAGVDAQGQDQICSILRDLTNHGIAILLVSHDIPLIAEYADRIACLSVSLHWHGAARELTDEIVHQAYRCELENYDASTHRKHVS